MPAMPFPCAKAEAVAAMMSAAERIVFLFLTMFLFINCPCFLPSKGWMVLCRAVDTFLLYFGLVVALLVPRTWVCPLRTGCALRFLAAWVDCHSFMFFPFSVVIHSCGCRTPRCCQARRTLCFLLVPR